jgi:PAS domain S-box-containing protein
LIYSNNQIISNFVFLVNIMVGECGIADSLDKDEKYSYFLGCSHSSFNELESFEESSEELLKEKPGKIMTDFQISEDKYRLIAESTSDLIAITTFSLQPVFTYVSSSYKKNLGYDPNDLLGKNPFDFMHPEDKKRVLPVLKKYLILHKNNSLVGKEYDVVERFKCRFRDKKGGWHYIENTANLIGNEILFVVKDVTEHKMAEEALIRSEDRYRDLFDNISSGVAVYEVVGDGIDFIFKDYNRAAEQIDGVKREEILGKRVTRVFSGIKDFGLFDVFLRVWKSGKPEHFPVSLYKDERVVGWRENYVYRLSSGEIVAVYDDVTEGKRAELALIESERLLNQVSDIAKIGGWEMDLKQGGRATWTRGTYDIVDIEPGEHIPGINEHVDWYLPEYRELVRSKMQDLLISRKPMRFEAMFQTRKGNLKWCLAVGEAIERDGQVVKLRGMLQDITDRKKAEKELQDAHEMLQVVNSELERKVTERTAEVEYLLKYKEEFINQLGHDLKNPLGPLISLLPVLQKYETDSNKKKMIEIMIRNTSYMKNLIAKTIELAKLNSPNMEFTFETVNFKEEVGEVIENNKFMFDEKQIQIVDYVSNDLFFKGDKLRIHELLNNIFNNAVKYSHDGGVITVEAKQDDSSITISVRDTGIGMSQDQINKIFNEFYKADSSRHDFDSSGLGMSICKRIVEKHGGKIWVESPGINKGTTIYFTLESKSKKNVIHNKDENFCGPSHGSHIKWINHNGKQILFFNYSNIKPLEYDREHKDISEFVKELNRYDLLVLTNVQGDYFNIDDFRKTSELGKVLKSYIKKNAIIGLTPQQEIFLKAVKLFSGIKLKSFKNIESAKEWLVE